MRKAELPRLVLFGWRQNHRTGHIRLETHKLYGSYLTDGQTQQRGRAGTPRKPRSRQQGWPQISVPCYVAGWCSPWPTALLVLCSTQLGSLFSPQPPQRTISTPTSEDSGPFDVDIRPCLPSAREGQRVRLPHPKLPYGPVGKGLNLKVGTEYLGSGQVWGMHIFICPVHFRVMLVTEHRGAPSIPAPALSHRAQLPRERHGENTRHEDKESFQGGGGDEGQRGGSTGTIVNRLGIIS